MPQFILNAPASAQHPYYTLSDFAKGYVEAMFFTDADTGDERQCLLNELGVERLTKASVAEVAADCAAFLVHEIAPGVTVDGLLADLPEGYDMARAGNDFWFTRQGHGAGYWDRKHLRLDLWSTDADPSAPWVDLPAPCDEYAMGYTFRGILGDLLADAAKAQGEAFCYVNSGWIYHK